MKLLTTILLAGTVSMVGALPSRADPIFELGLSIDVSGSISASNFALQKNAYINVLGNSAIVPQDGSVAIGVIAFDDTIHPVFTTTVITPSTIGSLIAALQTNLLDFGGATAIGDSINYLSNQLLGNSITSARQIIDVSTDGDGNVGVNQVTAANAAITAGIEQVNCLGIGTGANCNFARGTDSFSETVGSFADFETSLERKITREIPPNPNPIPVPEPASLLTLSIGGLCLAAIGWRRRRG